MSTDKANEKASEIGQKASEIGQNLADKANAIAAKLHCGWSSRTQSIEHCPHSNGSVVAAPGQIVTEKTIERARLYHLEEALLKSVGLSNTTAAKSRVESAVDTTTDKIGDTADRLQTGAERIIDWAKYQADRLRDRTAQTLDEQQIKGAIGRPTTRVILDRQDNVCPQRWGIDHPPSDRGS